MTAGQPQQGNRPSSQLLLRQLLVGRLRADWVAMRRRCQADGDRRGMVLIMTLLMITILTTLGSAAVMHTATELREGGGYRLERDVYRISEAGTVALITMAGQMQGAFEGYIAVGPNFSPDTGYATFDRHTVGPVLELDAGSKTPSFGKELLGFAAIDPINFEVHVFQPEISTSVPGYDASRFCFRNFRFETTAIIGSATPASQAEATRPGGEAAIVAQVMVGPTPCGG